MILKILLQNFRTFYGIVYGSNNRRPSLIMDLIRAIVHSELSKRLALNEAIISLNLNYTAELSSVIYTGCLVNTLSSRNIPMLKVTYKTYIEVKNLIFPKKF
jgi:hypothetical protein